MKLHPILLILIISFQFVQGREWTNNEGSSFEGELISANETQARIIRSIDKRHFTVERSALSDPDNQFIDQHLAAIKVEELRKAIPDTYIKALRKTKESGKKTIILYAPDFNRQKLELIINKILLDKQLMNSISNEANLAILMNRERKMEAELPWPANEKAINLFLYTDLFEHTSFSFKEDLDDYIFDAAFNELLKHRR